jgi:hypothetical protein
MSKKIDNVKKNNAASYSHFTLLPSSTLQYVTKNLAANGRIDPSFTKAEQEHFIQAIKDGFTVLMNDLKLTKEDKYQDLITIENPGEDKSGVYNIALPN